MTQGRPVIKLMLSDQDGGIQTEIQVRAAKRQHLKPSASNSSYHRKPNGRLSVMEDLVLLC